MLDIPGEYKNSVGIGAGGGFSFNNDAPNVSATLEYGRTIVGPWGFSLAAAWDEEYRRSNGNRRAAQQLALQVVLTYELTNRIGLLAGFSRTFFEKAEGQSWEGAGADDWALGGGGSYSLPLGDRWGVGPGVIVAYDFDNSEWRTEAELSLSFAF